MPGSVTQEVANDTSGTGTTLGVAIGGVSTTNTILHVPFSFDMSLGTTGTITDGSNTYNTIGNVTDGPDSQRGENSYAKAATGGSLTVTLNTPGGNGSRCILVREIAGINVTGTPLDGHNENFQAGAPTGPDQLVSNAASNSLTAFMSAFSFMTASSGGGFTPSAGSGFTAGGNFWNSAVGGCRTESQASVAAGSNQATFTAPSSTSYLTLMAMFDEVSGPIINTQPADQYVWAGQTANFTISATTSGGTLHYQWKKNGSNVGTDSSTYSPVAAQSDNGAIITCVVTDDNASTTSQDAHLFVQGSASLMWLRR